MCIFATITKPNITCDEWLDGEMIHDEIDNLLEWK
jgi:hypothetical protein